MARAARASAKAIQYAGSDSDSDQGPRRVGGRPPSDDSSDGEDASFGAKRQPLGQNKRLANTVNGGTNGKKGPVNGDKRRLSGKVSDKRKSLGVVGRTASGVALSPPSTPRPSNARTVSMQRTPNERPAMPAGGGHGVAALARVREASNGSFLAMGSPRGPTAGLVVSKEVMNTNYEEWMKMATDNKINAQNTWSFALIDYFHDMSLLRNPEDEGGINFQKASCTLDGCVKIWTSRVDSVATETGKLLSGLAEDAANPGAFDDDDLEGGGDDEAESGRPKRQRAPRAQGSTLVDFNDKIKVKKLELEFTVDPLFSKTCADFDEGGAAGILMNHLGIDGDMRVVFDAGDATLVNDDEDESDPDEQTLVDVTKLKELCLPPLDELEHRSLCPSLASFKFSTSESAGSFDIAALKAAAADDVPVPGSMPMHSDAGDADRSGADFFAGADIGGGDDYEGGGEDFFGGGGGDGEYDDDDGNEGARSAPMGMAVALGGVEAYDPSRAPNERDIVMAMQEGEGAGSMFDYFDKGFMKNWAGPEHWKLRRTMKKNDQQGSTAPKTRKERQPFSIDFEGEPSQTRKELFASSSVSTTLPKPKGGRRRSARSGSGNDEKSKNDNTLPDDMHFNSQQLLRLFLKPKAIVNMRRRGPAQPAPDGEIDENFWAQQAAAAQADAAGGDDDDDDKSPQIPFATQFFNDEGDDVPDFEEEFDNPVGDLGADGGAAAHDGTAEEEDLIAATQGQLKRARPEFVNYAKKAKRVDVKKLKENIWRELEEVAKDIPAEVPEPAEDEDEVAAAPTKAFTKVLGGLRRMYPEDKMEEISTSFCFICLLHLANEKGLRIQGDSTRLLQEQEEEAGAEGDESDAKDEPAEGTKFVGGLEELRIFKDRVATSGAGDA